MRSSLKMCEVIIFDNDGVLVDSEVIHIAVEQELLAELGLIYEPEIYATRFVGLSNADFYAALRSDYIAATGDAFPDDFAERLNARVWPRIEAELKPISGARKLIEASGRKVAVASSAPLERLRRKLEITGLDRLLSPNIFSADHVRKGKPAPDLFLYSAAQLKTEPRNCAVIEDSVNGVKAAKAAGMLPIGFVGGGHADPKLADRLSANGASIIVSNFAEIEQLLC